MRGPSGPIGAVGAPGPTVTGTLVASGPVLANGTQYLRIGVNGSTSNEAAAQLAVPHESAQVIQIRARVAQPSLSGTRRFRLRVNGLDTYGQEGGCCRSEFVCELEPGERLCTSEAAWTWLPAGTLLSVQAESNSAVATTASVVFDLKSD